MTSAIEAGHSGVPERRDTGRARPSLRVVIASARPSRFAAAGIFAVVFAAFAAVGINVARVEGQRRLDGVNLEINSERARADALRRREAKIQSPAEVVRIASEELGLVPAAPPVMVAAPAWVVSPPTTVVPSPQTTAPGGSPATPADPTR